FLEVAESQHITKSAENLHIAQPALTQAIHRLESELEVPLFEHKGRGIILNAYGKYFYKKLKPIITELSELPLDLKKMADLEDSTIHLNVLAASKLVTEAVIEYKKIDKNLRIELTQNEETELYDICITTKLFYQNQDENNDVFVTTEKIFMAVPDNEKFSGKKSIKLKDVQNENFISLLGSRQLRTICDKYCRASGIIPNIIFESDSPEAVKKMIGANMGIGFWPSFSWGKLNSKNVKLLEITSPQCSRDILISYKKNKIHSERVEKFYKFLCEYFNRHSS
ncbi:MAG: LysR family transcriptional regulator, partial [Treponema sp.]|nr:LysR family transcriptional regulator [Treponema sp.]